MLSLIDVAFPETFNPPAAMIQPKVPPPTNIIDNIMNMTLNLQDNSS